MHATKELIPPRQDRASRRKITAIMTPTLQKAGIEDADFHEDTLKALNTASIGTEYTTPYSPR